MPPHALLKVTLVELVATLVFTVLFGALVGQKPAAGAAGGVLAGLAYFVCSAAAGPSSGGHVSPSVTASLMASGHAAPGAGLAYLVAQVSGGLCGALVAVLTFHPRPHLAGHGDGKSPGGPLCLPSLGSAGPGWAAAAWEAGGTFVVVYCAFAYGVSKQRRASPASTSALAAPAIMGAAVATVTAAAAAAGGPAARVVHLNPSLTIASLIFDCAPGAGKAAAVHLTAQLVGAALATAAAVAALGLWHGKDAVEVGVGVGEEEAIAPLLGRETSPAPGLPVLGGEV
jgi:glycerol uptake facilitator-like aquaporin